MFRSQYFYHMTQIPYEVIVPELATKPIQEIEAWGVHSTENEKEDKKLAGRLIRKRIAIMELLNYREMGIHVEIPNRKEMVEMTEFIGLFLMDYQQYIASSMNAQLDSNAPMMGLLELLNMDLYNRLNNLEKKVPQALPVQQRIGIPTMGILDSSHACRDETPVNNYQERYGSVGHLLKERLYNGRPRR